MKHATWPARIILLILCGVILYAILSARRGRKMYLRRIPGLNAIDEAVGRAVEMGRPILGSIGLGDVDVITLQALAIISSVATTAAKFAHRIVLPLRNAAQVPIVEEALRAAYTAGGRPDVFNEQDLPFLSGEQFAYAAGVAGIIQRERPAATFLFGTFFAEALIIAENANQVGAIQIAGTPSTTQVPFFIAACDYVLIGDEYYAATAYITRQPTLLGSLIGQDIGKMSLLGCIILGVVLITLGSPLMLNLFGDKDLETFAAYFQAATGGK